jgi:hypothetical protein
VQVFTSLIVIAIIAGLGWEAYVFFIKPKMQSNATAPVVNSDTAAAPNPDTVAASTQPVQQPAYSSTDTADVRYVFETTSMLQRAKTRTAQLVSFGNPAAYDSFSSESGKYYVLFIHKRSVISDTLRIRDSLQKFLQKSIRIQLPPRQ